MRGFLNINMDNNTNKSNANNYIDSSVMKDDFKITTILQECNTELGILRDGSYGKINQNSNSLCRLKNYSYFNNECTNTIQDFYFTGYVLCFQGKFVDLEQKELVFKLIRCFLDQDDLTLSKNQILKYVYNKEKKYLSRRQQNCLSNCTNKLIDRTRKTLSENFDNLENPKWQWLKFNKKTVRYELINTYID